ncbi:MAG: DUF1266 domain-containing protein, partial [Treponema sp.]|nr:DUF1266 domain-containing protein [Treponema sp.]
MLSEILRILGKDFPKFPKARVLTEDEQRALNVGAIIAGTRKEFYNSLETAKKGEVRKNLLRSWWGVTSAESAVETLDRLKERGHRKGYQVVLKSATELLEKQISFHDFIKAYEKAGDTIIDEDIAEEYPHESELVIMNFTVLVEINNEQDYEKRNQLIEQHISLFEDAETFNDCMGIYGTVVNNYRDFNRSINVLMQNMEE